MWRTPPTALLLLSLAVPALAQNSANGPSAGNPSQDHNHGEGQHQGKDSGTSAINNLSAHVGIANGPDGLGTVGAGIGGAGGAAGIIEQGPGKAGTGAPAGGASAQ